MAEGFAQTLGKGMVEAHSAGLMAAGVNARAIVVMRETGVDISGQRSREIDPDLLRTMDVVVTLCDNAARSCPVTPPGVKKMHWPIKDPVGVVGTEEEIMRDFRRARDEIKEKIQCLIESLSADSVEVQKK